MVSSAELADSEGSGEFIDCGHKPMVGTEFSILLCMISCFMEFDIHSPLGWEDKT